MKVYKLEKIFELIEEENSCPVCNKCNKCYFKYGEKKCYYINNDHFLSYDKFSFIFNKYKYYCNIVDSTIQIKKSINEAYNIYHLDDDFLDCIKIDIQDIDVKSYKELYDYIYKVVENSLFL